MSEPKDPPPDDDVFEWLYATDPKARGLSRRAYARLTGILIESIQSDIAACEVCDDRIGPDHCPACAKKAHVAQSSAA